MAEWLKATVLKTVVGVSLPWVRIPLSPPQMHDLKEFLLIPLSHPPSVPTSLRSPGLPANRTCSTARPLLFVRTRSATSTLYARETVDSG